MIRDAYRFIAPLLIIALIAAFTRVAWVSIPCVLLAAFVCYFFRNPHREIPEGNNLVVSPADGKVVKIVPLPQVGDERGGHAISIFLNVFDVHVNRSPIEGTLENLEYKRGLFKAAYDDSASQLNEQNVLEIRGDGMTVVVKQIAGLIARRVICWKRPGQKLARGELFGLIRFGSRVDVLLPSLVKVTVRVGDRVKGGCSILGERE